MTTSENGIHLRTESTSTYSASVLIAEDDPMFRRILQSWLQGWGYQVKVAEDGTRAWEILQQEHCPELLILDWIMPGLNGVEVCRKVRDRQKFPYQYILLVTAKDNKQDVVQGLEAGADDYLTKPFDRNELHARLRVGTRILGLQYDLISAREELRFQATHDSLTGIWNRAATLGFLQRELERAARTRVSVAVLMLDLDHFKDINDSHGHLAGDVVLRETAHRLAQHIRSYDLLGRYGGEEFLLVLPECNAPQAAQSAERLRAVIAATPVVVESQQIPVTASVGVAMSCAGVPTDRETLHAADVALYRAKNEGRNRVVMA